MKLNAVFVMMTTAKKVTKVSSLNVVLINIYYVLSVSINLMKENANALYVVN